MPKTFLRENEYVPIFFIHTLSICNFNHHPQKISKYIHEKNPNYGTGLTNIGYFYIQLYKFKKVILHVHTKVVYTQVCT